MGPDANKFPLVLDGLLPGVDSSDGTSVGFEAVGLNIVIAPVVVSVVSLIIKLTSTIVQSILLYTSKGGQLFNA